MIILVLKLKNIFVIPFKYLFTCEMFSLFPPNFKDKWQTFFLLALYWIIFEKKQQGILQYSKLWVSIFSWMTFCAQSETYGKIMPFVCLFIFAYFLPNSYSLLLLFWGLCPTAQSGQVWVRLSPEHRTQICRMENCVRARARTHRAQCPEPGLGRCWPGGL